MKIFLVSSCLWAISVQATFAQVVSFEKAFGYSNGFGQWLDGGLGVFELADSSVIVLSFSDGLQAMQTKCIVTHFSSIGDQLSESAYGRDSVYFYEGEQGTLVRTLDNGFAVAGSGGKNGIDTWATLWLFNSDGDSILEKDYGSLGESDSLEILYAITQLPDSGFAMVGVSGLNQDSFPIPQINPNILLIRTDKFGNLLWKKTYDQAFDDEGLHIALFDSSHLIICGYRKEYATTVDTPLIMVTDLDGNITKEKTFPDPPYNCWALIGPRLFKAIDQHFLFTGCLNGALQNGFYENPEYIAKVDTDLNFVWEHDFNSASLQYIYHARQNADSSIMIVGTQTDSVTGREWGWVSKLDNNGNVVWDKLYKHGNSYTNYLYDIDQTYDCGFVVSGTTVAQNNQQSWLLKMDRYGCINPVCDTLPGSCGLGIPTNSNTQWQSVSTLTLDASLYPNPADDVVNVFYNLPQGTNAAQVIIFDVNGRKIFEQKLSGATHLSTIDVSAWVSGVYVCVIKTQSEILTREILVGR